MAPGSAAGVGCDGVVVAAFLVTVFFAVVFLAAVFLVAAFLAVAFFAVVFLAATFLRVVFFLAAGLVSSDPGADLGAWSPDGGVLSDSDIPELGKSEGAWRRGAEPVLVTCWDEGEYAAVADQWLGS